MYFVIYATIIFVLVLTNVLTVQGAWLLGIPAFLVCFVAGAFIRLCGYWAKYEKMEEELTSLSEKLRGNDIEKKILSGLIRFGSHALGPVGGLIGGFFADLIDNGQEDREELKQRYLELSNIIERQRVIRNWSIVMMFVFTAGFWTLRYFRII